MQIPGRTFSSTSYRYGFNGKENDNEVKGAGNQQDYGMRIYDPRLSRFLSVDPLYKSYAELSSYQYASNSPIENIDLDGLEKYSIHLRQIEGEYQIIKVETDNSIKYKSSGSIWSQPIMKPRVVQYIYEDNKGNIVNKTAEIPLKNFGNTIYVGSFNPKYGKADGPDKAGTDRYDLPPINSLDAAGRRHDIGYARLGASGPMDAFGDLQTLELDKKLVFDAMSVAGMYYLGIVDPVSKQPVSSETKDAALKVAGIFTAVVGEKTARIAASKSLNFVEKKVTGAWDGLTGSVSTAVSQMVSTVNEAVNVVEQKLTPPSHQ